MKKIIIVMLALVIVFTSTGAFAKERPEAVNIMGDLFIMRPLGFCSFVLGTAVFIVALPTAAISKSTKQTADVLVGDTYRFTFTRPLGEIPSGL
ncbi:MAG: hypothetical protein C4560_00320 [Nitrospiraceae bacterium]|nr:MAG: hypothetical protein C4560_00320 [Nitrospiraceae bacterium]